MRARARLLPRLIRTVPDYTGTVPETTFFQVVFGDHQARIQSWDKWSALIWSCSAKKSEELLSTWSVIKPFRMIIVNAHEDENPAVWWAGPLKKAYNWISLTNFLVCILYFASAKNFARAVSLFWKSSATLQQLKAMTTFSRWDVGDFHQAALLLFSLLSLPLSSTPLLSSCHISISSTNTHCAHNYEHTSCLTSFFFFFLFWKTKLFLKKEKLREITPLKKKNIIFLNRTKFF